MPLLTLRTYRQAPTVVHDPRIFSVWPAVQAAADRITASMGAAILRALIGSQGVIDVDALASALLRQDMRSVYDLLGFNLPEKPVGPILTDYIGRVASSGAKAAIPTLPTIIPSFDLVNTAAVDWARKYAALRVTALTRDEREAVRDAIVQGYQDGSGPDVVARRLRTMVGLNRRQAAALAKYRGLLVTEKVPPARAAQLGDRYARRLLRQRATMIARTELQTAANRGQQILWEEARRAGTISSQYERMWIITQGTACPECMALEGQRAPIGSVYRNGSVGPPLHVCCRCTEGLVLRSAT